MRNAPIKDITWWDYDAIKQVTVCGQLVNGKIIAGENGYTFQYQKGIRLSETKKINKATVTATLGYDDDSRLNITNYSTNEEVKRGYDNAGRLNHYTDVKMGITHFSHDREFNNAGQLSIDTQILSGKKTVTTPNYHPLSGLLWTQNTSYPDNGSGSSAYKYRYKDAAEVSGIFTTQSIPKAKSTSAQSTIYQGPNGEMNAALGVINQSGDKPFAENRFFTSTPDGLVLERNTTL